MELLILPYFHGHSYIRGNSQEGRKLPGLIMASFGGGATPWPHSIKHRSGQSMLDSPIPFTILCELEGFFFPLNCLSQASNLSLCFSVYDLFTYSLVPNHH